MQNFEIAPYRDAYRDQVLKTWEDAVLATHDFLSQSDFQEIRKLVKSIDFNAFAVRCLVKQDEVAGFIGVADQKIEMLFIRPEYFGQGLGFKLLDFAVKELGADKVDVNEQNGKGLVFYQKCGFQVFERTEKDDQGRNYPILRMKLVNKK